jgi:hypothetical protein
MPTYRFVSRVLSSVLCVLTASSLAARADELLVMPYSCRVAGGHPVLTPSEDQGHPVIGRREQREFRACSPANPDLCHRWTVHRFDLDCGGRRVPWIEVAAAAEDLRRARAYVSDGRLELEMPPRWSLPPGSPCLRQRDAEEDRFGAFARFCAERLANARRLTVAMPAGFAPMLGIDGIFVNNPAPRGAVADSSPPQRGVPRETTSPPPPGEPVSPPSSAPAKKEPAKEKTAPPAPATEPRPAETQVATAKAAAPAVPKQEPKKTASSSDVTPAPDKTPVSDLPPVIPKIINSELVPAPPAKRPERPEIETSSVDTQVAGASTTAPDRPPVADSNEVTALPLPGTRWRLDADVTTISVVGGALLMLLSFALLRRGRTPLPLRDISAVSLDGTREQPSTIGLGALVPRSERSTDVGEALSPGLPGLPSGPPSAIGDAMPRTREEALTVLGMGIAPDVNEAAIKKIIDGLRLSWHPDHARDAEDRKMRELRLKQINAAWEIIAGRQAS